MLACFVYGVTGVLALYLLMAIGYRWWVRTAQVRVHHQDGRVVTVRGVFRFNSSPVLVQGSASPRALFTHGLHPAADVPRLDVAVVAIPGDGRDYRHAHRD